MINQHIFDRAIVPAPRRRTIQVPLRGQPMRRRRPATTQPMAQPPPVEAD
jgi:hypothetical protein